MNRPGKKMEIDLQEQRWAPDQEDRSKLLSSIEIGNTLD